MDKNRLDLYTDYLISSFSKVTATGLSNLLDNDLSHDRITDFLAESTLGPKELWSLVKADIRKIESSEGVICIDDTFIEKPYSDENEVISYYYDHSKGHNIKGMNLLNALYFNQETRIPLAFEVIHKDQEFIDPKDGKEKRRSSVSKNELCRQMLGQIQRNQVQFSYVLADVWFASCDNMSFIVHKLHKHFVMPMKSNRLVALDFEKLKEGSWVSISSLQIPETQWLQVYLKGLPFPVALCRQVFTNQDGSQGTIYLVCSDLSLTVDQAQAIYQKRWKVEEFHKSIKSNTGLAQSPTRVIRTQLNHVFSSIYAFVKLERLRHSTHLNHFALKTKLYTHALKAAFLELQQTQAKLALLAPS